MPDFYYVDMYFENDSSRFSDVVDGCISGILAAGGTFKRIMMSTMSSGGGAPVNMDDHIRLAPKDIKAVAAAYVDDMLAEGNAVISFPHLGRVIFEYDFKLDEELYDDIEDEEAATRTKAHDIGLTFFYYDNQAPGRKIKVSLSFWEEFLLKHCSSETSEYNTAKVLHILENINEKASPSFGAMNNEIHLNLDRSLDAMLSGSLPYGNEYVLVGRSMEDQLDLRRLIADGVPYRKLKGGGVVVMFKKKTF